MNHKRNLEKIRRFVLVVPKEEYGVRYYSMLQPNWGRYHYDDPSEALAARDALAPSLKEKMKIDAVEVIEADCWHHGDCCCTIFDTGYVARNKR